MQQSETKHLQTKRLSYFTAKMPEELCYQVGSYGVSILKATKLRLHTQVHFTTKYTVDWEIFVVKLFSSEWSKDEN